MRILLLCHGYPPDSVGGVEQHVSGLAEALARAGHAVEVFARGNLPGRAQGEHETTVEGNPTVHRVAYRWEGVDSLDAMYACRPMADALSTFLRGRAAAGVHFDVAHVHHLTGMSVDALQALAQARVPTLMTLHDYWLFCPRGQMFHHREQACETAPVARCADCLHRTFPWWVRSADDHAPVERLQARARDALALPWRLVLPSARGLDPFLALGVPRERFVVVENGVDTERLERLPPPAAGPGPLRLGYLGTVMPSKGLHVLLAAMARLPVGAATLDVYGNAVPYHGDWTYLTKTFAGLSPGHGVRYHGPYGLGDLPRILDGIDVLAAPALWHEAFGLTVREALAAARPVLVSRVGGLQDAVEPEVQGLVLPPGDVPAWAAAIARLAGDRDLVARMSRSARTRARGFVAMADELTVLYRSAVEAIAPRG
jgi:glycosyltransferase involved in cell wall biosynthesis